VMYPPNPIRNLDNSLTASQQIGREHFFKPATTFTTFSCNDCHTLDPQGNAELGVARPGFFGTSGSTQFDAPNNLIEGGRSPLKAPLLRNQYQKIGMFGIPDINFLGLFVKGTGPVGDQVRGFGFTHDGSTNLQSFNAAPVFSTLISPNGFPATFGSQGELLPTAEGQRIVDGVFDFLMAFDSNFAPIVGQQVTL